MFGPDRCRRAEKHRVGHADDGDVLLEEPVDVRAECDQAIPRGAGARGAGPCGVGSCGAGSCGAGLVACRRLKGL